MLTFTVLAVEVMIWQSNDISVSIDTTSKETKKDLSITVRNTAGLTLLFFENRYISGCVEYLNGDEWERFCDISYTSQNVNAISQRYAGVFAELNPGENWSISIPDDAKSKMVPGTYRIKLTYTTASDYKSYQDKKFKELLENDGDGTDEDSVVSDAAPDASPAFEEEGHFDSVRSEVFVKIFEYEDEESIIIAEDSSVGPVKDDKYSYIPMVEQDI